MMVRKLWNLYEEILMKNIKMRIIGDGMDDWFTLYLDDKFVTHGHMIDEKHHQANTGKPWLYG